MLEHIESSHNPHVAIEPREASAPTYVKSVVRRGEVPAPPPAKQRKIAPKQPAVAKSLLPKVERVVVGGVPMATGAVDSSSRMKFIAKREALNKAPYPEGMFKNTNAHKNNITLIACLEPGCGVHAREMVAMSAHVLDAHLQGSPHFRCKICTFVSSSAHTVQCHINQVNTQYYLLRVQSKKVKIFVLPRSISAASFATSCPTRRTSSSRMSGDTIKTFCCR